MARVVMAVATDGHDEQLFPSDVRACCEDGTADGGVAPLLEAPQPKALGWAPGGGRVRLLGAVAALALTFALAVTFAMTSPSLGLRHGLSETVELAGGDKQLHLNSRRRRRFSPELGDKNKGLEECMGDCNWDLYEFKADDHDNYVTVDDCPGKLKCYKYGVPPGCKGKAVDNIAYCFHDPNSVLMMVSAKRARTDLAIALSQHQTPRIVDMMATSSGTFGYHLKRARTEGTGEFAYLHAEKGGTYKHVVLQEYDQIVVNGWTSRRRGNDAKWKESSAHLDALDEMVQKQGGRTVLFQVWGHRDRFDEEMPKVREHIEDWQEYLTRRRRVGYSPLIAPMGDAYEIIKKSSEKEFMGLFEKDNAYHESEDGRYLGAMVLFETVTGDSCIGLRGPVDTKFTAAKTKKFQEAAHEACTKVKKIPLDN